MEEIWKPVVGYEGLYEISNIGRCRSIMYHGKPRIFILKKLYGSNNYYYYHMYKNGKMSRLTAHSLVAYAFLKAPETSKRLCVNHKNGIKTDNRIENLEIVTYGDNLLHSIRYLKNKHGQHGKTGKLCVHSKPVLQISISGDIIRLWDSSYDAQRDLGFTSSGIGKCARGELKHHKGFIWKYAK